MKRLLFVLPLLLIVGCDKTPPTVSISSHSSGQTVKQTVTIKVTTQDNKWISRVEFFLNNSHISTDSKSPYEYDWNTLEFEDGEYASKDPSDISNNQLCPLYPDCGDGEITSEDEQDTSNCP